ARRSRAGARGAQGAAPTAGRRQHAASSLRAPTAAFGTPAAALDTSACRGSAFDASLGTPSLLGSSLRGSALGAFALGSCFAFRDHARLRAAGGLARVGGDPFA